MSEQQKTGADTPTWQNVGKHFLILLAVMVAAGVIKAVVGHPPKGQGYLKPAEFKLRPEDVQTTRR